MGSKLIIFIGCLSSFLIGQQTSAVTLVGESIPLTSEASFYQAPKWSPQGNTIAMTGHKYSGIYLFEFGAGSISTLAEEPSAGYGFAWSNDGLKIAARVAKFENKKRLNALCIYYLATGERDYLTEYIPNLPGIPKWAADDRAIYLSGTNIFHAYPVVDINPVKNDTKIEPVVYIAHDKLFVRNSVDGNENKVNTENQPILAAVVSPDGSKIVYEVYGGNLWVSDLRGNKAIDLGPGNEPVWNPLSNKIAYMVTSDDGHRIIASDIFVVRADGSGHINLTNTDDVLEMRPDWSPDGRWIVYDTDYLGQIRIQEVR